MQSLEVSGAVRLIYKSLGVKGLMFIKLGITQCHSGKVILGTGVPLSKYLVCQN